MRRLFIKVVFLFLVIGIFVGAVARAFYDVKEDSPLFEFVNELYESGVVVGYSDGSFRPNSLINRAEFLKIWLGTFGVATSGTDCFPDVEKQWFAAYVCAAKDLGLVKGYSDGHFRPYKEISFVEAAKILVLSYGAVDGLTFEEGVPWYEVYVNELSERIILPESVDATDALLTRDEVVEIVYRIATSRPDLNTTLSPGDSGVIEKVSEAFVSDVIATDVNVFFGSGVDCESNPDIKFTASFVDLSDVVLFTPPGEISGGFVKPHSFVEVVSDKMIPVYAPVDSTLVNGVFGVDPKNPGGEGEYALDFMVSCEFNYGFGHIDEVIPAIKNLFPDTPQFGTGNDNPASFNLKFKAGDLIAYTNGTDAAKRFDFGAYHSGHKNYFVNMDRYNYKLHSLHSVCPYDYFVESLQPAFFDKFGSIGGKLAPNAECQLATQDVAGTISGAWFSIADLGVDWAAMGVEDVAIGRELGGGSVRVSTSKHGDIWVPLDWPTFKDPKEITGEHCYLDDRDRGIVYLKLISDMEMRAFFDPTAEVCPAAFPESGYEVYYR